MPLAPTQRKLNPPASPSFCAGRKRGDVEQAWWWTLLHEDPQCPSRLLLDQGARSHAPLDLSVRHLHRLRGGGQLKRPKGRPRQAPCRRPAASGAEVVQMRPRLPYVGGHLFAQWREQQGAFDPVLAQLKQAIEAHQHAQPGDDFALVHPCEQTLLRRVQALFFAPLLGIERRTAFATHEHPLATLLGRNDQSATLQQFRGPLERVGAGEALMPARLPAQAGQITYSDGPRIASGSRVALPKGQSTLRGRIMAGSQAGIAHTAAGHAVFVAYPPPDSQVSRLIVADGQKVVEATGSALLVIDRAVNALAMAAAFAKQDWGLLCRLDDPAHQGLESFDATAEGILDDGSQGSSGPWKEPREDALRHLVSVDPPEGKTLGSWGTPQVKEALAPTAWPRVSRERTERQEHSCKRLIDHGALESNYGRQKLVGPDRHQQRQRAQLDASLETAQQRVDTQVEAREVQQGKVAASTSPGPGQRLEQRQQALVRVAEALEGAQHQPAQLAPQASA
jgi:hypothetical protein